MRIKIIALAFMFIFVQRVMAGDELAKITRIELTASDKIEYESRFIDNPPRLIVKFLTPGVFGKLKEDAVINHGAVSNIEVTYYPNEPADMELKQIKFLTVWLNQGATYKVWTSGDKIFLDFKSPSLLADAKEIEISNVISIKDTNSKNIAADALLTQVVSSKNKVTASRNKQDNVLWLLLFAFTAFYILWYRPEGWKRLVTAVITFSYPSNTVREKRKWWRHSIPPLKKKAVSVEINSFETKEKISTVPKDLGYGGLCLECDRTKKLKGRLGIKMFVPGNKAPVEVNGNIAWQKNSWNPLKRLIGISFINNPPEPQWIGIHKYIEQQYAALK